jgi:Uma2 family endonuclease
LRPATPRALILNSELWPQILAARLTADDFLEFYSEQEDELRRSQLYDGKVVEPPVANRVLVETTFELDGVLSFRPDLAVTGGGRWKSIREKFDTGSPGIAFEVVSSDRADRPQFKIDGYLDHGSKAVG